MKKQTILRKIRCIKIISPTDFIKWFLSHFDKTDLYVVMVVFITGIISNFYFFITDGLQADALSYAHFKVAGLWETQLGRPLIQVVDRLRFGFVNQFLIVLMCLLLIAGAMLLIRRTFDIKNKFLLILLSVVVCVSPQFVETYEFLYCADSYLLAFFCSALAVYLMSRIKNGVKFRKNMGWYIGIVIMTMVVCGLYQAYLGCIAGFAIFLAIKETLSEKDKALVGLKRFVCNSVCVALGMCLYYVFLCLYCEVLNTNLASYKGASSFGVGTFLQLPSSIAHCYIDFFRFFFANDMIYNKYYHRDVVYAVLFLASAGGLLFKLLRSDEEKRTKLVRAGVVLLLFAIVPIGVNVMNIVAPTTRINLVTGPGLISTFVFVAISFGGLPNSYVKWSRSDNILRWVNSCALIVLAWTLIISNTFTYIYRQRQYDNLETILQDIYGRVVLLDGYDAKAPWMFSNIIQVQVNDVTRTNGMVARNMIVWQNFNGTRQYASFIYKYKGIRIDTVDSEVYRKIVNTDQFKKMPVYPNKGAVDIIDGVVVIKISEKTF